MTDAFFRSHIGYSIDEALDLVAVLLGAREFLEAQAIWTPLVVEVGSEEGRLLDKLAP